jgi:hypothetical protein
VRAESRGQGAEGGGQRAVLLHVPVVLFFAAFAVAWTWPLALHVRDHIPGDPGDNYSFLWNLWWMRTALAAPELDFFHSTYLFSPFGVDLINHPHTALQGYLSATLLGRMTVIEAENLYVIVSVFLNAVCAYALAYDVTRSRRSALVAGVAFGGSPYIAAHLLGHFDLLTAWVLPLFALCFRRAIDHGRITAAVGCGVCVTVAAYAAYYHVVYLALFALTYTLASWHVISLTRAPRPHRQILFTARLLIVAMIALVIAAIVMVVLSGGGVFTVGGREVSVTDTRNPLLVLWLLGLTWWLTKVRFAIRIRKPGPDVFWRAIQTLMISAAVFAVLCLPLIMQAFRLAVSGRYVTQTYFWRSAPRGVDVLAPFLGNPFHPWYGDAVSGLYETLGLNRIEAVGWLGIVPLVVLLTSRGRWSDADEARRWKWVCGVFAVWALGPFLTVAGFDAALPLPQALARFVPLVDNARMPGRAMVCVYLAIGMLMVMRLAAERRGLGFMTAVILLLAVDFLPAPIPLTALDRPAVYEQLASIDDVGAVIEVPFGIGDGLTVGRGRQERRLLYNATIHNHPVVGGYIGRMPPQAAQAYEAMPVVGNLLRLSNGEDTVEDEGAIGLPFRYLVLDTTAAAPQLIEYVRSALDMDLITRSDGKELYAVQGLKAPNLRARYTERRDITK